MASLATKDMLNGLFSLEGPLGEALNKLADWMLLSLLWMICSIPLVTIGAANTALYTMTLRMVRNEEGGIIKGFLKAFKDNFLQSTFIHLFLTVLLGILLLNRVAIATMPQQIQIVFYIVSALCFLFWLMETLFVYPIQARFSNSFWATIKNACLMAAGSAPYFLLMVAMSSIPFLVLFFYTNMFLKLLFVWIFVAPGLIAWGNSHFLHRCFQKYIPEEEKKLEEF